MPRPAAPATLLLSAKIADSNTFHYGPDCENVQDRAGGTPEHPATDAQVREHFIEFPSHGWDGIETTERRFCRTCALEPVSRGVLTPQPGEPTTRTTVACWPPVAVFALTKTGRAKARYKPPRLDRAAPRLAAVAAALGHHTITAGAAGTVMIADVPDRALGFLSRNYWFSTPPADVCPTDDVVESAWQFFTARPPELTAGDPDHVSYDDWWRACSAAHA